MSVIIEADQLKKIDFSGASIYLDACFMITYLDKDDSRQADVIDTLASWADSDNVSLAISNHIVSEVINRFFHSLILTSLDTYHRHKHPINHTRDGYDRLPQITKDKLLNLESAKFIYKVAKDTTLLQSYRNQQVSARVNDLIKIIKDDSAFSQKRNLLDIFYNRAVDMFNGFFQTVNHQLGIPIIIKESGDNDYNLALTYMRLLQLDSTDAFHLAIASNHCNYLATLDGDFAHNLYDRVDNWNFPILKIS